MIKKPWSRSLLSFSGPGASSGPTWAPAPLQLLGMPRFLTPLPAFQMNSGTLLQPLISVVSNSASKVSVWCVYIFKDKIINANKLTICESSRQDFKMCEIMSAMWLKFDKISKTADYHCTAFMFCWREGIFI